MRRKIFLKRIKKTKYLFHNIEYNKNLFYFRTNIFILLNFILCVPKKNIDYTYIERFFKKHAIKSLLYREKRYIFFKIIDILRMFNLSIFPKFYETTVSFFNNTYIKGIC